MGKKEACTALSLLSTNVQFYNFTFLQNPEFKRAALVWGAGAELGAKLAPVLLT